MGESLSDAVVAPAYTPPLFTSVDSVTEAEVLGVAVNTLFAITDDTDPEVVATRQ